MIFTILKVIGIILLVVLALILAVVLCVLLVPVKYRAVGSFDNTDIRAKAHASWLLHLFALHIEYADEADGYIRLAFVKKKLFDDSDSDYEAGRQVFYCTPYLIQGLIIMKLCILTQWMMMPKRKMKAQHRFITSKGQ